MAGATAGACATGRGVRIRFQAVASLTLATDDAMPERVHAMLTMDEQGAIVLRVALGLSRETTADVLLWAYDLVLAGCEGTHAYVCGLGSVRVAAA